MIMRQEFDYKLYKFTALMKSFKSAKHRRLLYRFARESNICEIQLQRFVR